MAYAWMAEDKASALLGQGLSFLGMRERRGKEVFLNGQDSAVMCKAGMTGVTVGPGWGPSPLNQPLSGIGRGLRFSEPPQLILYISTVGDCQESPSLTCEHQVEFVKKKPVVVSGLPTACAP